MKHAQIVGYQVRYGAEQETHVKVEIYEMVSVNIRRRLDYMEISLNGATEDYEQIRGATEFSLRSAGIIGEDDRVLTDREAHEAIMQGVTP